MTYILLIVLTLNSPEQESKDIELRIPYSNKEECLKASKKNRFLFQVSWKKYNNKVRMYS